MALYDFFVGSTSHHNAHSEFTNSREWSIDKFASSHGNMRKQSVYGVWDGEVENVAQYTIELADDATAQRIAYGLAILTGNDAVLVSRLAINGEESLVFASARRYLVSTETRTTGKRSIGGNPARECERHGGAWGDDETCERCTTEDGDARPASESFTQAVGYAYVRDSRGSHVAYLVWSDASVTAVD